MTTTVSRSACELRVKVKIQYKNETDAVSAQDFQAKLDEWTEALTTFWNDGGWVVVNCPANNGYWTAEEWVWKSCDVVFEFEHALYVNAWSSGYHHITIRDSVPAGAHIFVGDISQGLSGMWEYIEAGVVVAHEAGHLMGLEDEYDQSDSDTMYHIPDRDDGRLCIMAYTGSHCGIATEGHVYEILEAVSARCYFFCHFRIGKIKRKLEYLLRIFRRPPPPIRRHPGSGLPWAEEHPIDQIFDAAKSGHPDDFLGAVAALQRRDGLRAEDLTSRLDTGTPIERSVAAIVLADVHGSEAEAALREALRDEDESVRVHAARSLAQRGLSDGVPVLIAALESDALFLRHPPELVRAYANRVLETFWRHSVGFDAHANVRERQTAIEAWRAWWAEDPSRAPVLRGRPR